MVLRRQSGVIARTQALEAGLSPSGIARLLKSGEWARLHNGIYRATVVGVSWEQAVIAAVLATGGVVSHRSAARLWRLDGRWGEVVAITSTGKTRPDGAIIHRARLAAKEVTRVGLIPVTDVARTLLDLGAVCSEVEVRTALDDALRRRLVTVEKLRERIGEFGGRGRRGWAVMRRLLEEPQAESVLERRLLALLRRYRLPQPVTQFEVRERGRVVARLDLAYPDVRLAIEADGFAFHGGPEAHARDLARRNRLTVLGWSVLHVTWADVKERPARVAEQVRRALGGAGQLIFAPDRPVSGIREAKNRW